MHAGPLLHPEPAALAAFNVGKLESAEMEAIERHLAECPRCCETLAGLQDDTFVSLVRGADTVSDGPARACEHDPTVVGDAAGPLATGEVPAELAGHARYRVLELLGSGGMGAVYKAEHRLMQRIVALKVINPRLTENPAAVERFQREVRTAARLRHPNIVIAYDAEQAGGLHFMVMEFLDGTDLAEIVRRRGPLPVAEACEYIRQAAQGLQHAHEEGLVHRDIKPQNLMVEGRWLRVEREDLVSGRSSSDPQPSTLNSQLSLRILDFGLAHFASESASQGALTEAGTVMGTPDYMAPEQARDAHAADIRADIYSLGCTLYFLLAGRPPFPRGSVVEKVMAHTERAPERLASVRDDIPAGLERVLDRMTAKSPSQRYQTPAEVARALEPFATGAAPVVPARKVVRAALAAAALLLLLAATVVTVATNKGTLRVQYPADANVEVTVSRDGRTVAIDRSSGSKVHRLPSGEYDVDLKGDAQFRLDTNEFTLTRGKDVILRITRVEAAPEMSDQERLQGTWHGQQIVREAGRRAERISLRFEGTRVFYRSEDRKDRDSENTFELDPSQRPKHIDIASIVRPTRARGIYKFEDDSLHLVLAESGDPRPVDFDPASFKSDVGVMMLTRRERPRESDGAGAQGRDQTGRSIRVFLRATLTGHDDDLAEVVFSPDGKLLASAGGDRTIRLWDAGTGQLRQTLEGHTSTVWSIDISANGKLLASGSDDNTIRLWDVETGEVVRTIAEESYAVAFSPNQALLASLNGEESISLWDVETGRRRRTLPGHGEDTWDVVFAPDGRRLASCGMDALIRIWDVESGNERQALKGQTGSVSGVAFSPDGSLLASASMDGTLKLWDLAAGKELHTFRGHENAVHAVAFSPDGRWLASASKDRTAILWDAATGDQLARLSEHKAGLWSVAFSPDGRTLATAGDDETVRLWDIEVLAAEGNNAGAPSAGKAGRRPRTLVVNGGFEEGAAAADQSVPYWVALPKTTPIEPDARCTRETESAAEGRACVRVEKPEFAFPLTEAGFLQSIPDLPAGRLIVSGLVKTQDVVGAAAIKLRIVDPRKGPAPIQAVETPAVKGTTEWTRYEASIEVPAGTVGELGLVIQGKGTVWFDDIAVRPAVNLLENGGFDQLDENGRPAGWLPIGLGVEGVTMEVSSPVKHGGAASATIGNKAGGLEPYNWRQELDAGELHGQTLRLAGWAKTKDIGGAAVGVQLLDAEGRIISFHSTQHIVNFTGSVDWKPFDLQFTVPEHTARIAVLTMLFGRGQVWFDDFQLTAVPAADGGSGPDSEKQP